MQAILTLAAIAITVLSAVGAAMLTGFVAESRLELKQVERSAPKAPAKKKAPPRAPEPEPIYREAGKAPIA